MKDAKRCPHCDSTSDLPHATDADCFRAVNREMAAAIALVRDVTRRKGKLLRERIRVRQEAAVKGHARQGRAPSPLSARRRLTRFK